MSIFFMALAAFAQISAAIANSRLDKLKDRIDTLERTLNSHDIR